MQIDQINGETRVYAIIGDPISAVRTPAVFNAMFSRENANAVLVPLLVAKSQLKEAWEGLKTFGNLDAVVVTMPHKMAMCDLVDEIGDNGRMVGAINAVRRRSDGCWEGDMFDGVGCVHGLKTQGHEVAGRDVFLLGTGGAGAAVAAALAQAGVRRLVISDLDKARCEQIAGRIRNVCPKTIVEIGNIQDGPYDIAINATPLGMRADDPLPFDPRNFPETTLIVDVITKPEFTPLLNLAKETGHAIQTGKHMHHGQAILVAAFFGFTLT